VQQFCEEERDEVMEFCDNTLCFFDDMCEGELEEFTLTMKRDGSGSVDFLVVQENGKTVTDGFEFYEHDSGVDDIPEDLSLEEDVDEGYADAEDDDGPECNCDWCLKQRAKEQYEALRKSTVSEFEHGLISRLRGMLGPSVRFKFSTT